MIRRVLSRFPSSAAASLPRSLPLSSHFQCLTIPATRFSTSSTPANASSSSFPALYPPTPLTQSTAYLNSFSSYFTMYRESLTSPNEFWRNQALTLLDWNKEFTELQAGSFAEANARWFCGGELNVSYNCVDRWAKVQPNKVALIYEGDDASQSRTFTYRQLHEEVCKMANYMESIGVQQGSTVCIYMPMVPEAAVAMLACARIGAIHSVVFAGFSIDALRDRLIDAKAKYLLTADATIRGGKKIHLLKDVVENAVQATEKEGFRVENVLVYRHTEEVWEPKDSRYQEWSSTLSRQSAHHIPRPISSDHPLFYLYTSGSTGKPKGIVHATGQYLTYAATTAKYALDIHPNDVFFSTSDIGWITGHTYQVYAPLALGSTSIMFEGVPVYPNPSRYWEIVDRHKVSIFYCAPTAIRTLMKFGDEPLKKSSRESIRLLGSVGEPINPEAWRWYYNSVGKARCSIIDTWWQTEGSGCMMTPFPGATPMKPGSCAYPSFGIEPVLLHAESGKEIPFVPGQASSGVLAIKQPWPGLCRGVFGDPQRFKNTYFDPYPGYFFTGDGASRDGDGLFTITGRTDDVVNVSGHRIGTAEVESALVLDKRVSEAAVVGVNHEVKGSALFCFVILKADVQLPRDSAGLDKLVKELKGMVRQEIGPFATPDSLVITPHLPKTRSGKLMRRLLRKVAAGETDIKSFGDLSTLAEPHVVEELIEAVQKLRK